MSAFEIRPTALATGLASFVPGVRRFMVRGTGGTCSARYCYTVWLRHLVKADAAGIPTVHSCVAELGPGDSLGTGLAALLSGATRYVALDAKSHANPEQNLAIFEELVLLFRRREPIPNDDEFPLVRPKLQGYQFPRQILSDERLATALAESRIDNIRAAISGRASGAIGLDYRAPWTDPSVVVSGSVDFLLSQAVLEHVDDLEQTYRAMRAWVKPNGFVSHSIDFTSHNLTRSWNGHWTLNDPAWRIVRGTRPYLINREPLSRHLSLLSNNGFVVVHVDKQEALVDPALRLAKRFREMDGVDVSTRGAFVQAQAT
jgi:methyltransferase family protein